jgi:hypothetical protein
LEASVLQYMDLPTGLLESIHHIASGLSGERKGREREREREEKEGGKRRKGRTEGGEGKGEDVIPFITASEVSTSSSTTFYSR